jgi:hypothetical protein
MKRRTVIVEGPLAFRMRRVDAARLGLNACCVRRSRNALAERHQIAPCWIFWMPKAPGLPAHSAVRVQARLIWGTACSQSFQPAVPARTASPRMRSWYDGLGRLLGPPELPSVQMHHRITAICGLWRHGPSSIRCAAPAAFPMPAIVMCNASHLWPIPFVIAREDLLKIGGSTRVADVIAEPVSNPLGCLVQLVRFVGLQLRQWSNFAVIAVGSPIEARVFRAGA